VLQSDINAFPRSRVRSDLTGLHVLGRTKMLRVLADEVNDDWGQTTGRPLEEVSVSRL
jgi:hypothetical protein